MYWTQRKTNRNRERQRIHKATKESMYTCGRPLAFQTSRHPVKGLSRTQGHKTWLRPRRAWHSQPSRGRDLQPRCLTQAKRAGVDVEMAGQQGWAA